MRPRSPSPRAAGRAASLPDDGVERPAHRLVRVLDGRLSELEEDALLARDPRRFAIISPSTPLLYHPPRKLHDQPVRSSASLHVRWADCRASDPALILREPSGPSR